MVERLLPATLVESFVQMSRDLHMLRITLGGRFPSPLIPRPVVSAAVALPDTAPRARRMKVLAVEAATPGAAAVTLASLSGKPVRFIPGQFFTLRVPVGERVLRRAYSATNDPEDGTGNLCLAVKRVEGGVVSGFINDHLAPGDRLEVVGPSGRFVAQPDAERARHLVLLGGGSGITPLMSICRGIMRREPKSKVTLVYGNRSLEETIFHEELTRLADRFPGRLIVRHVLSDPPVGWAAGRGILDRRTLDALVPIEPGAAGAGDTRYFICGPEPMREAARGLLAARGVAAARIREERFTSPPDLRRQGSDRPRQASIAGADGDVVSVTVEPGQTILEAASRRGVPLNHSCTMGGCGACRLVLRSGEVDLAEPNCLTDQERAEGVVLACVSAPVTDVELEVAP